jgi:hypothetical protein
MVGSIEDVGDMSYGFSPTARAGWKRAGWEVPRDQACRLPILGELAREGRIRITGETISLI